MPVAMKCYTPHVFTCVCVGVRVCLLLMLLFPGVPQSKAFGSMGIRSGHQNRLHQQLDRQGHPLRLLDLWILLPPGLPDRNPAELCPKSDHFY